MPGMHHANVSLTNTSVVSLFHHRIEATSLYWIIPLALLLVLGAVFFRRIDKFNLSAEGISEPRSRSYLRFGFGVVWIIDGLLEFQSAIPLGTGNQIIRPSLQEAPTWLQPLMVHGIYIWNAHPIIFATASGWIEIGFGLGLIVSNAGLGRLAGIGSALWALAVWIIADGAGGIFSLSGSVLFGWPGAPVFYVVAGVWIAVPTRVFKERFAIVTLRGVAVLMLIGIVLQSLPTTQFWHGGNSNAFTSMTQDMTAIAQPHPLSWVVRNVGTIAGNLGGGFNIIVLLWFAVCAVGLWIASTKNVMWPIGVFVVGALFFWITAQDVPVFGGLATDVNSLIPLIILVVAGSAWVRNRAPLFRRSPKEFRSGTGAVAVAFAVSMVLYSVVTMGVATASPADNTLYLAKNSQAVGTNAPDFNFTLTDQFGHPFTLNDQKGRYVLLTFLDPVCWTDCPLLAAQLKQVSEDLPANAPLTIVAVAANPLHETEANVHHFIQIHYLGSLKHFYFVDGSLKDLRATWNHYGIGVSSEAGEAMSVHSDYMFILSAKQRIRWIIPDDPLAGVAGQESTESELLQLLHASGLS